MCSLSPAEIEENANMKLVLMQLLSDLWSLVVTLRSGHKNPFTFFPKIFGFVQIISLYDGTQTTSWRFSSHNAVFNKKMESSLICTFLYLKAQWGNVDNFLINFVIISNTCLDVHLGV